MEKVFCEVRFRVANITYAVEVSALNFNEAYGLALGELLKNGIRADVLDRIFHATVIARSCHYRVNKQAFLRWMNLDSNDMTSRVAQAEVRHLLRPILRIVKDRWEFA